MTESPVPHLPVFTPEQRQVVTTWVGAFVAGQTDDPATVLMNRFIKERAAPPPRRPVNIEGEILGFIKRWRAGQAGATSELVHELEAAVSERVGALQAVDEQSTFAPRVATQTLTLPPESGPEYEAEQAALIERIKELEAVNDELEDAAASAHNWRYRLEAGAREVQSTMHRLFRVLKRAPSQDEAEGMLNVLRDAIHGRGR